MAWTTPRTWVAEEFVTASQLNTHLRDNLNHLYDTTMVPRTAFASSSIQLTTTPTDIPGCTQTLTTTTPGALAIVIGTFDFYMSAATSPNTAAGSLVVDGTLVTSHNAALAHGSANDLRATVGQTWGVSLAAAGQHTLKLQAYKSTSGGQQWEALAPGTHIAIIAYD